MRFLKMKLKFEEAKNRSFFEMIGDGLKSAGKAVGKAVLAPVKFVGELVKEMEKA